jgi:hypothetical protein
MRSSGLGELFPAAESVVFRQSELGFGQGNLRIVDLFIRPFGEPTDPAKELTGSGDPATLSREKHLRLLLEVVDAGMAGER